MRALTPKQERFVQELVRGCSQREAYREAYDCEKSSDRTVDKKASLLYVRADIRGRYDELQAEAAKLVVWDRAKAAQDLIEVRQIALEHIRQTRGHKVNTTDKGSRELADLPKASIQLVISSTAELNRMFSVYDSGDDDGKVAVIDDV
ncbi:MAG: terminase small subunit [Coriobacteriia bacterium]